MPVLPMDIDNSTVATTSAITAAITYFFGTTVLELKASVSLVIAAGVGIVLYAIGVIPIGLLLVVGVSMVIAIFKSITSGTRAPDSQSEKARRRALGYDD